MNFTGYATVFDTPTFIGRAADGFWERVDPGAFDRALRERQDVRLLVNHEGVPLARTAKGTMRLSTDRKGLRVLADLAPTTAGKDLLISLRRGDMSEMSFAFVPVEGGERWERSGGKVTRVVTDVDVCDVSVVGFPAYPGTSAKVLSAEEVARQKKVAELRLRVLHHKLAMVEEDIRRPTPAELRLLELRQRLDRAMGR